MTAGCCHLAAAIVGLTIQTTIGVRAFAIALLLQALENEKHIDDSDSEQRFIIT